MFKFIYFDDLTRGTTNGDWLNRRGKNQRQKLITMAGPNIGGINNTCQQLIPPNSKARNRWRQLVDGIKRRHNPQQ